MTITFSSAAKRPPAFYETRKVSVVRVSLWDATPSSVAATSDSEAITAVSTKISSSLQIRRFVAGCSEMFRMIMPPTSSKVVRFFLDWLCLNMETARCLVKVWETPRDMTSHPTRQYLHSQLRKNLLKSRIHYYFFFPASRHIYTLCRTHKLNCLPGILTFTDSAFCT